MKVKRIEKPWGYELVISHTPLYAGKILTIYKNKKLSLQYHQIKDETIFIYKGKVKLEFFPVSHHAPIQTIELSSGQSFHISPKIVHRLIALEDTEVFEVSSPQIDDVVRLEDDYGRASS